MTLSVISGAVKSGREDRLWVTRNRPKSSISGFRHGQDTTIYAAAAEHRSVSDFVLEGALARAEETLADCRHFELSEEDRSAFVAALDAPPRHLPRVKRLFDEPGMFEKSGDR